MRTFSLLLDVGTQGLYPRMRRAEADMDGSRGLSQMLEVQLFHVLKVQEIPASRWASFPPLSPRGIKTS